MSRVHHIIWGLALVGHISQYLDTIAPDEVEKLKEIRSYLEGCQKLLEERVITLKTQIEQLEAQETAAN